MFRLIFVFFYLFPVSFIYFPYNITTRLILTIFGSIYFFLSNIKVRYYNIEKDFYLIFVLLFIILFVSASSLLINNQFDYQFVFYPLSIIFIILAAYFVVKQGKLDLYKLINYLIISISLQNFISFIFFLSPPVLNFFNSIQNLSSLDKIKFEELNSIRILGLGSSFFGSGIINSVGLILITYKLTVVKKRKFLNIYSFLFILNLIIGLFKARTILIGFLIIILG